MVIGQAVLHRATPRAVGYPRILTVVVVLVSLVYAAVLALNVATALAPPQLTLVLRTPVTGRARVAWVMPGGTLWDRGVRVGDLVLASDGNWPTRGTDGTWVGQRLTVRTGTHRLIVAAASGIRSGHDTWPLLLLSPWFLLLGTIIALGAKRPAQGRAGYALFGSLAFAFALAPGSDANGVAATVAEWAVNVLLAASFVIFFLAFPTPRGTSRLRAWLFAPPFIGVLGGLAAFLWPALYGPAYLTRMAVLLVYLLAGVGLLVYSFVTASDRETRRGLAIISASTAASILPFVTFYLVPTVLRRPPLLSSEQAIIGLLLLPAGFVYAIPRHGVLNVHLVQRWLVHGLLWALLLAPLAAVAYALRTRPSGVLSSLGGGIAVAILLAAMAAVAFGPLHGQLRRLGDRLIFKDSYDYRASLEGLSRDLSLAGDLDTLGTRLPATLHRLMNLDFAALLVRDGDGLGVRAAAGAYQPALLPALAVAAADVRDEPRAVSLEYGYLTVLVVPLRTQDVLAGHLCLGPKATGEPFRAEDRALLATLSGHLAAIVHNAHLVDDLRGQARALDALNERLSRTQEEERARLAADLHDEPLQTALDLQRQIVIDGHGRAATARHIAISRDLIAQLRALCTATRPPALDHLGLHAALDQLARERGARAGVPIMVDADPEIMELDVPAAAELVLYRAAQEALNNCLRHARPRAVRITLCRQGDGAQLDVADDGVGFAVPAHFEELALSGHLGLAGLCVRVRHAGGSLHVTSSPGAGTTVRVDLPLAETPEEVVA